MYRDVGHDVTNYMGEALGFFAALIFCSLGGFSITILCMSFVSPFLFSTARCLSVLVSWRAVGWIWWALLWNVIIGWLFFWMQVYFTHHLSPSLLASVWVMAPSPCLLGVREAPFKNALCFVSPAATEIRLALHVF